MKVPPSSLNMCCHPHEHGCQVGARALANKKTLWTPHKQRQVWDARQGLVQYLAVPETYASIAGVMADTMQSSCVCPLGHSLRHMSHSTTAGPDSRLILFKSLQLTFSGHPLIAHTSTQNLCLASCCRVPSAECSAAIQSAEKLYDPAVLLGKIRLSIRPWCLAILSCRQKPGICGRLHS